MQPRTLQQILTEMDGVYAPQVDSLRQRQAAIPGQIQAEEQGLGAKQETAFGDILNGARRRGTGVAFGGIPAAEQAKYTATEYLPALARLRQSGREQAMSLEDAILGINERKYTMGQNIYSQEQQMAEQRRQFDEQMKAQREQAARAAAAASSFAPSLGGGGGGQGPQGPAVKGSYGYKNGKDGSGGYAFTDAIGNPISASQYAALNKINFSDLLTKMAQSGDSYARNALNSRTGPGIIDPNKFSLLFNISAPKKSGGAGGGW